MKLTAGGGGWCLVRDEGLNVYVRFADRADRLEAIELYWSAASEPVTPDRLRELRLGVISAWANRTEVAAAIRARLDEPVRLAFQAGDVDPRPVRGRRWDRAALTPPAGAGKRPDGFYRQVAAAYGDLTGTSPRPAIEISRIAGVPLSTAHRWIKEARRRGFLPPGRRGKAG